MLLVAVALSHVQRVPLWLAATFSFRPRLCPFVVRLVAAFEVQGTCCELRQRPCVLQLQQRTLRKLTLVACLATARSVTGLVGE